MAPQDESILEKLDHAAAPLAKFDAFPKLPSTYKARSESRGFLTLVIGLIAFLLVLNDVGEYIWGWPHFEFSVDNDLSPYLTVNVDMVVNMPCQFLSVDIRDAVGDRLFLSGGVKRDGVVFDIGKATALKEHAQALSARQAIAQSRKSRGFFSTLLRTAQPDFKPTYDHTPGATACRVYGHLIVKKVTANLHITTLGHGYTSFEHVPHEKMNLSHVITEFSFGPFFPDITQPLDNSFEVAAEPFTAYQYFLHVVPTTYIAPRTSPLRTNQYSVTHYTRVLEHNRGTPGIFFKFDLDPMSITIHQRTTTLIQLILRCVGVIGGVFVCMGYAIRITTRAVEVVSGSDSSPGLVAAEASGAKAGLRGKWGGGELRSRTRLVPQGSGWTMEGVPGSPMPGTGSPYSSYAGTPANGTFPLPSAHSPYLAPGSVPPSPGPGTPIGLGYAPTGSAFGPPPSAPPMGRSPSLGYGPLKGPATSNGLPGSPYGGQQVPLPATPAYGHFPPTPNPANGNGSGFPNGGPPKKVANGKKDD
ncbi:DUF1692-domain-containing protein [Pluteus cervinus]|uniref:DUF1692-domain-containing protein n=1 Tax=Pluteus cervinus TaxID=181527 RepID=A0ACD3A8H3_9AGAR|nr:DUF1692-domain-containing protein [Pluteus cervinus]